MQPSVPGTPGQTHRTELRKDLDAAIETRRELGPEYESELVDAFLARIDSRLDARVEQRVAERLAELDLRGPQPRRRGKFGRLGYLPFTSLGMAVPLTAIGSDVLGGLGVVVAWAGIVGVNLAAALAERREEPHERGRFAASREWA